MAESTEEMSLQIIAAAAEAIQNHDTYEEICDMFINTVTYRKLLQGWTDSKTGLNLMQLAIVNKYPEIVEYLTNCSYIFSYRRTSSDPKINLPLHLACKVGCTKIIQFFIQTSLETEGENAVFFMLRDPGIVTYPQEHGREVQYKRKTPFELCVEAKHMESSLYLSRLIMKYLSSSFTGTPFYTYTEESTALHDACYLGSASYLRLLLENGNATSIGVRNQMGYQPLHVAASLHHSECMDVLLEYGAKVNAVAECKSALHLVFGYKANAEYLVDCTQVLIKHGIDINTMDHNHNTALGYLAWEYGQRYTPNVFLKTHKYSLIQANCKSKREVNCTDDYKREIFNCMELLLSNGASTMVRTSDGKVDHTLVHTLLQNTGYPLSSCLTMYPHHVYKVLQLFFAYIADPNLVARNNNESAFAMLIVHTLKEISATEVKCQFMHLFIINGTHLNCIMHEPKQNWENYPHRMWNMYPVLLALQEQHPMALIRMMYSFMSLRHMYHSFRQSSDRYLWYRITTGVSLGTSGAEGEQYKEQWKILKRELTKPRSIKHHCKLAILSTFGNRGRKVQYLPLPMFLKQYLVSAEC